MLRHFVLALVSLIGAVAVVGCKDHAQGSPNENNNNNNQIPTFEDQLALLSCSTGQVAKWDGSAWACADDLDTDTDTDSLAGLSCLPGDVVKWNGSAWVCADDFDTDTDTDTLADLSCNAGAVVKRVGGDWGCGTDERSPFVSTIIVGPVGTDLENGAALQLALAALASNTGASPKLVKLEPGTYDLGTQSVSLSAYVRLEGSGRLVTLIKNAGTAGWGGAINLGDHTELSALSVESLATEAGNQGIAIATMDSGSIIAISDVSVRASTNDSTKTIMGIEIAYNADVTLDNVSIAVLGTGHDAQGVFNSDSTVEMNNVTIVVTATAAGSAPSLFGVYDEYAANISLSGTRITLPAAVGLGVLLAPPPTGPGATAVLQDVRIAGGADAVRAAANSTLTAAMAYLQTGVTCAGTCACRFVYDDSATAYTNTCPP